MTITGLVDIHSHVIPGIDDGPPTLDEALDMIRAAEATGIRAMAATPHLRTDFPNVHVEEIADRLDALRKASTNAGLSVNLIPAAEASLAWALEADDTMLRQATYGGAGKDLLIETPASTTYGIERLLCEIQHRGYRITLAHPERSFDFQREPGRLAEIVTLGIRLQVNASSMLGKSRKSPTGSLARWMVSAGLVAALASDAHRGTGWRPVTDLNTASNLVAQMVGLHRATWMTTSSPTAILTATEAPPPPAAVTGRWAGRFRRRTTRPTY